MGFDGSDRWFDAPCNAPTTCVCELASAAPAPPLVPPRASFGVVLTRSGASCEGTEQGPNLGVFASANVCATSLARLQTPNCEAFMWSPLQPQWGCRCCYGVSGSHVAWNVYTAATPPLAPPPSPFGAMVPPPPSPPPFSECFLGALHCTPPSPPPPRPPPGTLECPGGWARHGRKCYRIDGAASQAGCQQRCAASLASTPSLPAAGLVCIESADEEDFVGRHFGVQSFCCNFADGDDGSMRTDQSCCTWLGLYQDADADHGAAGDPTAGWDYWRAPGCASTYRAWEEGEPDQTGGREEDCALLGAWGSTHWVDYACETSNRCLCELKLPETTGDSPPPSAASPAAAAPSASPSTHRWDGGPGAGLSRPTHGKGGGGSWVSALVVCLVVAGMLGGGAGYVWVHRQPLSAMRAFQSQLDESGTAISPISSTVLPGMALGGAVPMLTSDAGYASNYTELAGGLETASRRLEAGGANSSEAAA